VTTPWWFPSETRGGLMDASRIALPILPGMKWSDELPVLVQSVLVQSVLAIDGCELPAKKKVRARKTAAAVVIRGIRIGGLRLSPVVEEVVEVEAKTEKPVEKLGRIKRADPELAAKARELRDKYLEQFNAMAPALLSGKYDVARDVDAADRMEFVEPLKQLAA